MKIAFLNIYQNQVKRGAETFVAELSKRLSVNHSVDVLSKIKYLDLIKKRYDLIIPTNGRLQVFIVRIICLLTGAKMVVAGQSGIGFDDRLNLYAFPNAFVALSSKALNWAKKTNPFVRSVYIPNGVDLGKFTAKKDTNKKSDIKIILSVGAFTEQKRHQLVIEAVSKLSDVKLIVAGGGGNLKDEIANFGSQKLGKDRFEIIEVDHDKMPEVYKQADLFTLASAPSESFGIVIVEALASNLPVVVTNDDIRKEIAGQAGIFVDPGNITAYSVALEKALKTDWGNKPRLQAQKFSWDKIADSYEELFNNL